jgi:hypothetical protein
LGIARACEAADRAANRALILHYARSASGAAPASTMLQVGRYDHVLATIERDPAQPGRQPKLHAPGVGIIQVGAIDDPEDETLVFVDRRRLDKRAMAETRRETLKLDRHGRRTHEL